MINSEYLSNKNKWVDLELETGFSGTLQYYVDGRGFVYFRYDLTFNAPFNEDDLIATIPSGCSPAMISSGYGYASSGQFGYAASLKFNVDGTIRAAVSGSSGANSGSFTGNALYSIN